MSDSSSRSLTGVNNADGSPLSKVYHTLPWIKRKKPETVENAVSPRLHLVPPLVFVYTVRVIFFFEPLFIFLPSSLFLSVSLHFFLSLHLSVATYTFSRFPPSSFQRVLEHSWSLLGCKFKAFQTPYPFIPSSLFLLFLVSRSRSSGSRSALILS